MNITLLGTSCMVPTKERNVSGLYVDFEGEGLLFDCGEGTQRQMNMAGINRNKVKHIFISHWHADHVAGILGLVQTVGNKEQNPTIHIYGPVETKRRVQSLMDATYFDMQIDLQVHEFEEDTKILDTKKYEVYCAKLNHGIPCLGYRLVQKDKRRILLTKLKEFNIQEGPILSKFQDGEDVTVNGVLIKADDVTKIVKGKIFSYIADTSMCPSAISLSQDADLVVCEATYCNEHEENAHKYNHLTSAQAAQIASMAGAKKLILTHISQRYKNVSQIVDEAKDIFSETQIGYDLLSVKL